MSDDKNSKQVLQKSRYKETSQQTAKYEADAHFWKRFTFWRVQYSLLSFG